MDPAIGKWLKVCFGEDGGPDKAKPALSLKELTSWLVPNAAPLLKNQHTAGADATLHLKLAAALRELAGPQVARGRSNFKDLSKNVG